MLGTTELARTWLTPVETHHLFFGAWLIASLSQPLNALAFATDGIHWGTSDFRFLRDVVIVSTLIGIALLPIPVDPGHDLLWIWGVTGLWIMIRATAGVVRIWPGIGHAPLGGRLQRTHARIDR